MDTKSWYSIHKPAKKHKDHNDCQILVDIDALSDKDHKVFDSSLQVSLELLQWQTIFR